VNWRRLNPDIPMPRLFVAIMAAAILMFYFWVMIAAGRYGLAAFVFWLNVCAVAFLRNRRKRNSRHP
jgi:hypothetical protein